MVRYSSGVLPCAQGFAGVDKGQVMPLHMEGQNIAAMSAADHAAPAAGREVNAQGRRLVVVEGAQGRPPIAMTLQLHSGGVGEVGQWLRQQGAIEGKAGFLVSPARVRVSHG